MLFMIYDLWFNHENKLEKEKITWKFFFLVWNKSVYLWEMLWPDSGFNEFEPRLNSAKKRFQLSAGLILKHWLQF